MVTFVSDLGLLVGDLGGKTHNIVPQIPIIVNLVYHISEAAYWGRRASTVSFQWTDTQAIAEEQFLVKSCYLGYEPKQIVCLDALQTLTEFLHLKCQA